MSLAKWINFKWSNGHERVKHHEDCVKALTIAVEALELCGQGTVGKVMTHEDIGSECGEALRRIEALGK